MAVTIQVARLYGRHTAEWIAEVFRDPSCRAALPLSARNTEWQEDLAARVESGEVLALIPAVDGVAAGLYWGAGWESGIYSVHQFVLPRFRQGLLAVRLARACTEKAFELLPEAQYLIGFTPFSNRAAVVCAQRAGFRDYGLMPGFYDGEDCVMLVKVR